MMKELSVTRWVLARGGSVVRDELRDNGRVDIKFGDTARRSSGPGGLVIDSRENTTKQGGQGVNEE